MNQPRPATDAPDPRISRYKRRRRVWIATIISFILTTAWIFRPHWHADESLINPRLRALQKPYRMVDAEDFFDGGSTHLHITDALGRTETFYIPPHSEDQSLYILKDHRSRDGKIPVTNSSATLQKLSAILADHCVDLEDHICLSKMTGRLGDEIKVKAQFKWSDLKNWWAGFNF